MRNWCFISISLFLAGCHQNESQQVYQSPVRERPAVPPPPPPPQQLTEVRCIPAQPFTAGDGGIRCSSGNIFMLFNTMKSLVSAVSSNPMLFSTECLACQPVETYQGHLIFARQLEIFYDSTVYHPQPITNGQPAKPLHMITANRDAGKTRFRFSLGTGTVRYLKQACNDSDLNELVLQYEAGPAVFPRLVNGAFFEYDLNQDGLKEQYILSLYNCSQELTVFQVRQPV